MEYNDLELLRARILSASIDELDAVLDSMIKHYIELIPATELVCLFLPRNDMKERKKTDSQTERGFSFDTDIQLKTLSRRLEVFHMKVIMRRDFMIF